MVNPSISEASAQLAGVTRQQHNLLGEHVYEYFDYLCIMSTTLSLCHFVFNTYCRKMTIEPANEEALYRFIWKQLDKMRCKLLRIGGIPNHIHLLVDIHPSVSQAKLAGEIKRLSSVWMSGSGLFPYFEGWGKEYFGFSKSLSDKNTVIEYIKNQKEHHKFCSFEDEIRKMVSDEGIEWDDSLLT